VPKWLPKSTTNLSDQKLPKSCPKAAQKLPKIQMNAARMLRTALCAKLLDRVGQHLGKLLGNHVANLLGDPLGLGRPGKLAPGP